MTATETLTLRLPPDLKRWLEETARKHGKSQNAIVADAVAAAAAREKDESDVTR